MAEHDLPNVGDLAMLVRSEHDCLNGFLGMPFRVEAIGSTCSFYCCKCGQRGIVWDEAIIRASDASAGLPRSWCRRIKPLDESTGIDIADELDAGRGRKEPVPA